MALSHKARKRWSLVVLLVGMPLYVIAAVTVINLIWQEPNRPPVLAELGVYVGLGFLWALPFRKLFRGIGQADPDAPRD